MKKGLMVALVLVMAVSAFAFDDSYVPQLHTKKAGIARSKASAVSGNFYLATSTDFGATYGTSVNVTNFDYTLSGKWVMFNPSQVAIKADGNPVFSFAGGNDFNGYSHTWFWSEATGVVVVDSGPEYHGWTGMCVADNGDLYVSWGDYYLGGYPGWENAVEGDIYMARSTDNGATWGSAVNISDYIQALNANDSCQVYPKIAKRAIDGIHLFYADDSRAPGSNIQGVGADDTVHLRYAKVNLDLSGLDAAIGVQDMGTTAYDWVITGNTQGIVMDGSQNVLCAWTYGPVGDNNGAQRNIGYNYYVPGGGAGVAATLAPRRSGFPGIDISSDGYPMIVYHSTISGSLTGSGYIDEGGISTGLWGSEIIVTTPLYAWPSVAFTGPAATDSIAACGTINTNYLTTNYRTSPDGGSNWASTLFTGPDGGCGTYPAIGALHNNVFAVYEGDSTTFAPPQPPVLDVTVHTPTADSSTFWWLYTSTGLFYDVVDSFCVYAKVGSSGTWTLLATLDTVGVGVNDTLAFVAPVIMDSVWYAVTSKDPEGESAYSNQILLVNGEDGVAGTPAGTTSGKMVLNQNAPNPVKGNSEISFNLPRAGNYSITIYNIVGQPVNVLQGQGNPGMNKVTWNGCDKNGLKVSNGVYLYNLKALGNSATKKLVVVR